MSTILHNAPLIELVAELRWALPGVSVYDSSGAAVAIPQAFLDAGQTELFFQRFGSAIYQYGFKQVERLIPQLVPLLPGQMVYRYRQAGTDAEPVLAQIGPNQASINALRPYKSWEAFRPWIEKIVAALLEAREAPLPLRTSVRYIDAFRSDLTNGKAATEFLEDLGVRLQLPPAFTKHLRADAKVKASVSFNLPLGDDMQMAVKASEGIVSGELVTVLDTQVSSLVDVEPELDAVLQSFDRARSVIHDSFMELVKPIMDRFKQGKV